MKLEEVPSVEAARIEQTLEEAVSVKPAPVVVEAMMRVVAVAVAAMLVHSEYLPLLHQTHHKWID